MWKKFPRFTIEPSTLNTPATTFSNYGNAEWIITSSTPGKFHLEGFSGSQQAYRFKEGGTNRIEKISDRQIKLTVTGGNTTYSTGGSSGMFVIKFRTNLGTIFDAKAPTFSSNRQNNCELYNVPEEWI